MSLISRRGLGLIGYVAAMVLILALAGLSSAGAQDRYPSRTVHIIVPTPAGGPIDVMARLVANEIAPKLGQSVIVDNRGGAGNTIGSAEAARATPDGYTLLYSSSSGLVIAPMLQKSAGYDPLKSFDPVAVVAATANILVVNPSVPAKSVAELIAYAKANPGKVNFSSGGIGTLPHLIGEYFKSHAGIDVIHVPYRGGGPSIQDVVAGHVQYTFEGISVLLPLIKTGQLRALAVTSAQRSPLLPDVPTMIESGFPDFATSAWTGLLAPAGTPPEVIAKLNGAVNAALQTADMKAALDRLAGDPLGGPPAELTKVIQSDIGKWQPIIQALNLQTD
ncbi:MAG TPA: tripartite tricarboxylate transporter substrate binding protein [Xanthobacteraceae bacterium]|nr:tripartite tricarboxylate transporter substrate binding protein [Xanthobacteraceae bacterium]